jgi:hypothetical protein
MDEQPFPLSDAELFDFNARLMVDYDDERAHTLLEEYGDAFRYQLVAALHIAGWAEELADPENPVRRSIDPTQINGWVYALGHVAASLRQGYYLPGGESFEATVRREDPERNAE